MNRGQPRRRHRVGLRDVPRVPRVDRTARPAAQLRRVHRAHPTAAVRDGRRLRAARPRPRRSSRCAAWFAKRCEAGAAGFASSFGVVAPRLEGPQGAQPPRRRSRARGAVRGARRRTPRRGRDLARRRLHPRRSLRAAAERRRALHLRRAARATRKATSAGASSSTRGPGTTVRRCGRRSRRVRSPSSSAWRTVACSPPTPSSEALMGSSLETRRAAYADRAWRAAHRRRVRPPTVAAAPLGHLRHHALRARPVVLGRSRDRSRPSGARRRSRSALDLALGRARPRPHPAWRGLQR